MADIYITDEAKNIYDIRTADLLLPKFGNWSAQIDFGGIDKVPSGRVILWYYGTDWHGYVIRSGIQNAVGTAVLVGGRGGLWRDNPTKMYDFQVAASLPISEILSDCGEVLSPTSDQSILGRYIPNWTRTSGEAGKQLTEICNKLDVVWSVLPDGSVYIGNYTYPPADDNNLTLQAHDPTLLYSCYNALASAVRPGMTLTPIDTPYRVVAAHYRAEMHNPSKLHVWYSDPRKMTKHDPLRAGLAQFVREIVPTDYHAAYEGKVVLQRANGTLDVILDNNKFPPISSVPLSVPFPGAKINVKPGDRVIVKFLEGDPTKYIAELYTIKKGGKPLARKGDTVNVGTLVLKATGPGVYTMTYTDPLGVVQEGLTVNLKGVISSGSIVIEDS